MIGPATSEAAATLAAWLLTYALHSTALLGAAWAISLALGSRRLALQEILLRAALLGGLITATAQVGLGVRPYAGIVDLGAVGAPTATVAAERAPSLGPLLPLEPGVQKNAAAESSSSAAGGDPARTIRMPIPVVLTILWTAGALIGISRIAVSARRLREILRHRRLFPEGRLIRNLAQRLGIRRRVLVSCCRRIKVPFATGVRRPQICVPERVVDELSPSQQEGLFAHELAHISRHDPLWMLAYRWLEGLLFFQPLNRLTRQRLEVLSECLSDDDAARCTGNRVDLARCLVEVAHWVSADERLAPSVGALSAPSSLGRRVHRLLHGASPEGAGGHWTTPTLAVVIVLVAAVLPGVSCATRGSAAVTQPLVAPVAAVSEDVRDDPIPAPDVAPAVAEPGAAPAPRPSVAKVARPEAPSAPPSPAVPEPPKPSAPALLEDGERGRIDRLRREIERQVEMLTDQLRERTTKIDRLQAMIEAEVERLVSSAEGPSRIEADAKRMAEREERRIARRLARDRERLEAEERRLAEACARSLADGARQVEEDLRQALEQARQLAEEAGPSEQELRTLQRRARELAESTRPSREQVEELSRRTRDLAREAGERRIEVERLAREARDRAGEVALQQRELARELAQQAREQAREAAEMARRMSREAAERERRPRREETRQ